MRCCLPRYCLTMACLSMALCLKVHLVYMSLEDIMLCLSSQIFYMDIALHALHWFLFRILKRLESLCVLYYLQNFFYHPKLHLCVNSVKSNSSSTFFREKIRIPMCIYDVYSFVNKSPIICYFTISFQCWKNITFILLLE